MDELSQNGNTGALPMQHILRWSWPTRPPYPPPVMRARSSVRTIPCVPGQDTLSRAGILFSAADFVTAPNLPRCLPARVRLLCTETSTRLRACCTRPYSAPTIVIGNAVGLRENLLSSKLFRNVYSAARRRRTLSSGGLTALKCRAAGASLRWRSVLRALSVQVP